jgi:hypothetical protein
MAKCSACGREIGGSNSERCPATNANHKFDRVKDDEERAESDRRKVLGQAKR